MVDYSKWKNIEISDDEDDTHPNIDTPSLFRWRHQARVERMENYEQEVESYAKHRSEHENKLKEVKQKIENSAPNLDALKKSLEELEKEHVNIIKKGDELKKKEKVMPWNVDTISKPGFAKTVINTKPSKSKQETLTEEEREARMEKFIKENEKDLKHYGMLRRFEDSKAFLKAHSHLVCEDTANYLVIWCINLEMEKKCDLMAHVAHQTICMQCILELAKHLDYDPRACLESFFMRIQMADPEYKASFDEELKLFKQRITKRAHEKMEEAIKEAEEEERQQRLGPGGLDPIEVFESLPDELKKCFESQEIGLLQETIANMPEEDAKYHMKRCVDSGLWIPNANKDKDDTAEGEEDANNE
ncbi:PREDICTED: hsp90 co-chaperone Cdc37 [Nicrophorus vespilloides]|uniref:Hsp90 chaperone protein kinase-targeting subunit n=1 Tax=Nicrophorus vespilloides TaxID=110193 RepID=A0ABM1NH28_NICVS|nr:PREDICTED: hsp90 co-chaperone Cdc37 [Nicrophorus vespilloides]